MTALFNPVYHNRDDIEWGLVSNTVATFLFVTAYTAIQLHTLSICLIDHCEFTNLDGTLVGPHGCQSAIRLTVLGILPSPVHLLNNSPADGPLVGSFFDIWPAFPGT